MELINFEAVKINYYSVSVLLPLLSGTKIASFSAVINCRLYLVLFYHLFPHYVINSTIFGKELINIKYLF